MPNTLDILLVDDRVENLVALEALLRSPEYNLVRATSGEEALKHLLDRSPALILMDVQMPRLDGFETAALIKSNERTRTIPIIFVTAMSNEQQFVHRGFDYGAVDYVYKPYDGYVLCSKVAVFIEIQRQYQRTARLVAVQQAATQALGNACNEDEAIRHLMLAAGSLLDWQAGMCWMASPEDKVLRCVATWCQTRHDTPHTPRTLLPLGTGVPGHVWMNGKPVWRTSDDGNGLSQPFKLPSGELMRTLVCLPITVQNEVIGALEFYGASRADLDPSLLEIMAAIASQLGQAVKCFRAVGEAQEAVRARDQFFSLASHELKTPITSLKMSLQMARRGVDVKNDITPPAAQLAKTMTTSIKQVDQLTHLIEDMLDVVRIRAGKFTFQREQMDLSALLVDLLERYAEALAGAGCQVKSDIGPAVIGLWDPTRIEQVVVNLLSNAIKYAAGKPIELRLMQDGVAARLVVRDSGPGIPLNKQWTVFDRFDRGAAARTISGLGLGLFIVKQVVEAHGGTVSLESTEGQGSTFTIDLPLGLGASGTCESHAAS